MAFGNIKLFVFISIFTALLSGCGVEVSTDNKKGGIDTITEGDLLKHIEILASNEFEGRGPSSMGEEKTVKYLKDEFKRIGLVSGNGESYFQNVPLVSIFPDPTTIIEIMGGRGDDLSLNYNKDMMVWTTRVQENIVIDNAEMVFVGYGIVAPEFGWNDYEGVDVKDKVVVVMVNDPGYATQNDALFNGNSMTYYGRYTYKFEEAARQGAAGVYLIHETKPAAYPWAVVTGSWAGPNFNLDLEDGNMSAVGIEGWLNIDNTRKIFSKAELDYEALKLAAQEVSFKAVPMGLNTSINLQSTFKKSLSKNVVGILPGSEASEEYFLYMAHWDHLGMDTTLDGDKIYNGALDNASGTAALLELAEAFSTGGQAKRSIIFLAVTAEEQGLLGSAYYGANPIYPLSQTVAGLNMDGINWFGKTKDISIMGYGFSELDSYVEMAANLQGRYIAPDATPEKGSYFRSDHFELAKFGVPMVYPGPGIDHVEGGVEYGTLQNELYEEERYHKPSDEFDDTWVLSGGVEDIKLFYMIGYQLSNEETWPNWVYGNQFKVIRDQTRPEK
ncbi:MAG: M28 family metallopeptidase [Sphingomonadales bacterium]